MNVVLPVPSLKMTFPGERVKVLNSHSNRQMRPVLSLVQRTGVPKHHQSVCYSEIFWL